MLIDELMPRYDVAARYETLVNAELARAFSLVQHVDFSQSRVTRFLMAVRTLGRSRRARRDPDLNQKLTERIRGSGFVPLREIENQEIVIGVVGRFWQARSGIVLGLSPEDVLAFEKPGYAKALWNFHLASVAPNQTRLSTETRVQTFGPSARRKFVLYWSVVGPFSGWIRKEMLHLIRTAAEQPLSTADRPFGTKE